MTRRAMDPGRLLRRDHAVIRRLFAEFRRASPRAHRKRADIVAQLAAELRRHARLEDEILYPVLDGIAAARDTVAEARDDHAAMTVLLADVDRLAAAPPERDARLDDLRDIVLAHAVEEEVELLPLVEQLSPEQRAELGTALAERRREGRDRPATRPGPRAAA